MRCQSVPIPTDVACYQFKKLSRIFINHNHNHNREMKQNMMAFLRPLKSVYGDKYIFGETSMPSLNSILEQYWSIFSIMMIPITTMLMMKKCLIKPIFSLLFSRGPSVVRTLIPSLKWDIPGPFIVLGNATAFVARAAYFALCTWCFEIFQQFCTGYFGTIHALHTICSLYKLHEYQTIQKKKLSKVYKPHAFNILCYQQLKGRTLNDMQSF